MRRNRKKNLAVSDVILVNEKLWWYSPPVHHKFGATSIMLTAVLYDFAKRTFLSKIDPLSHPGGFEVVLLLRIY